MEQGGPPRGQGFFLIVRVLDQAHPPRLDRCEFVLRRACKPRRRFTSRTRLGRRPPRAARQAQPARRSAKRVQADPRPFLDRSVTLKVSNTWTNLWNNIVEENVGIQRQNSKPNPRKDSKRMSMPAAWREFCGFRIGLPVRV